jgi:hypothetical protein
MALHPTLLRRFGKHWPPVLVLVLTDRRVGQSRRQSMASEPIDQRKEAKQSAAGSRKTAEKARLAQALRENLRRRKMQRQARSSSCPTEKTD